MEFWPCLNLDVIVLWVYDSFNINNNFFGANNKFDCLQIVYGFLKCNSHFLSELSKFVRGFFLWCLICWLTWKSPAVCDPSNIHPQSDPAERVYLKPVTPPRFRLELNGLLSRALDNNQFDAAARLAPTFGKRNDPVDSGTQKKTIKKLKGTCPCGSRAIPDRHRRPSSGAPG